MEKDGKTSSENKGTNVMQHEIDEFMFSHKKEIINIDNIVDININTPPDNSSS